MRWISLAAALGASLTLTGCRTVAPIEPPPPPEAASPPALTPRATLPPRPARAASPAVIPAGFSYGAGKGSQEFASPAGAVQEAIPAAMSDLQIKNLREHRDGRSRIYQGWTKDNRPAILTFRPGNGAARVTARVGWFGDEPFSRALMERIGVRLGTLPPKAIPEEPPSAPAPNPYFSRQAVPDSAMLREQSERYLLLRDTAVPFD